MRVKAIGSELKSIFEKSLRVRGGINHEAVQQACEAAYLRMQGSSVLSYRPGSAKGAHPCIQRVRKSLADLDQLAGVHAGSSWDPGDMALPPVSQRAAR